jgi:type I restriction enzyme R subunit
MPNNSLSERDICTKYIIPALKRVGWDIHSQVREEVTLTHGRIIVRGRMCKRGQRKRADYILYYKHNIPIALIEAKDGAHAVSSGMQQALQYAEMTDIPFAYSTNGSGFLEHDRTGSLGVVEFVDSSGKIPRYYQLLAINRTVEDTTKGRERIILVMSPAPAKPTLLFKNSYGSDHPFFSHNCRALLDMDYDLWKVGFSILLRRYTSFSEDPFHCQTSIFRQKNP